MPAGALPSGVPSRTPSTLSAHSSTLLIAPDTYRMRNKLMGERPAYHLCRCSCRHWRPRYVDACPLALGLFRRQRTFFDIACRNRANENFSPLPTACDEIPPVSLPRSWFFITPSAVCPVCAATCAAMEMVRTPPIFFSRAARPAHGSKSASLSARLTPLPSQAHTS